MKYFVVADVHGFYNEMKSALDAAGFDTANPNHILVSLGDVFDRGDQPHEVLQFLMSLPQERRILIRGNHEDLMEDAISRGYFLSHDRTNGTRATALALTGAKNDWDALIKMRTQPLYNAYIRSCINYYETDKYIFVHGWIPHNVEVKGVTVTYKRHDYVARWRDADKYRWEMARWYNGMESWADGVREPNKTIVCGHWHTSWARCHINRTLSNEWTDNPAAFAPWCADGIAALDACTAHSHIVNCYVIEDTQSVVTE